MDAHTPADAIAAAEKPAGKAALYASRTKPYPKYITGTFRKLKWIVLAALLAVYYLTPFLRWDRGPGRPDQAILIDLPERRAYFFFIEIWPQEVYYITGVLVLAALGLFLVTSIAGRMWCGYACPQTVWTDLYRLVERWIEGDRNARIKLDKSGWTLNFLWRKTAKHSLWIAIAAATGGAWVLYFNDAPTILPALFTGEAGSGAYLFVALLTFTTYLLGGFAQEQVCIYMCPWPRIQAAMFDKESLLVTYREDRGEPRISPKKVEKLAAAGEPVGDCIDCRQCVMVCPQGIDIRDGSQLECIQCALCVDACDSVMDKIGRPRGLVGYYTELNEEQRAHGQPESVHIVRPRTIIYAAVLTLASAIMLYALTHRSDVELNLLADRNPLFIQLSDGSVRNSYTLKVLNKAPTQRAFDVRIDGIDGAHVTLGLGAAGAAQVVAPADDVLSQRLFVILPRDGLNQLRDGESDFRFILRDTATGEETIAPTSFRGPK